MKSKSNIYYPLILALAIFAVDKIALIPAVRDYGRPEMTPTENMLNSLAKLSHSDSSNTILLLGTSRADMFESLHPDEIRKGIHTSENEKKLLLKQNFETRAIIKASELFSSYVSIQRVIEEGFHPASIIVEVSPEMFNINSPTSLAAKFSEQIYPLPIIREMAEIGSGQVREEALYRLFFASYAYRFKPERAITNFIQQKKVTADNLSVYMLSQAPSVQRISEETVDFAGDQIPGNEYEERFAGYAKYLAEENVLRDYRYDPEELKILERIIQVTAQNNIRLILWMPPVHPVLAEHYEKNEFRLHRDEVISLIDKYNVPFYNGHLSTPQCNRFVDSSHLSPRCSPWLMSQILKAACDGGMKDYCADHVVSSRTD